MTFHLISCLSIVSVRIEFYLFPVAVPARPVILSDKPVRRILFSLWEYPVCIYFSHSVFIFDRSSITKPVAFYRLRLRLRLRLLFRFVLFSVSFSFSDSFVFVSELLPWNE